MFSLAKILPINLYAALIALLAFQNGLTIIATSGISTSLAKDLNTTPGQSIDIPIFMSYVLVVSTIVLISTLFIFLTFGAEIQFSTEYGNVSNLIVLSVLLISRVFYEAICLKLNLLIMLGIARFIEAIAQAVLFSVFITYDSSLHGLVTVLTISYILFFLPTTLLLTKIQPIGLDNINWARIKLLYGNAFVKVVKLFISAIITAPVIPFVLMMEKDVTNIATIGISQQIHAIAMFIPTQITTLLIPRLISNTTNNKSYLSNYIKTTIFITVIIFLAALPIAPYVSNFYDKLPNLITYGYIFILSVVPHTIMKLTTQILIIENNYRVVLLTNIIWAATFVMSYIIFQHFQIPYGFAQSFFLAYLVAACHRLLILYSQWQKR